ncbi:MAG: diadenylate cyclase [Planctomycetaceae bacterium]|nr:diadenylate cyclase [Planctomycetaceae bacterium]
MDETSTYPIDLAKALARHWQLHDLPPAELPDEASLTTLLDVMYQASLLQEEGDPVRCRTLFADPPALSNLDAGDQNQLQVLPFLEPVPFTPHNIRKLSAAAGYFRSLLAVHANEGDNLLIWAVVVTGTEWINRVDGCRFDGTALPQNLVVQAAGPGHLIVASGYSRILETRNGQLLTEGFDPFRSEWLPKRFVHVRESLLQQLLNDRHEHKSPQICESFVRDVAQNVVRRVLRLVRNRRHGGMLLFLPDGSHEDGTCARWLRLRIQYRPDESPMLYHRLMLRLMTRALDVGRSNQLSVVTWNDFQRLHDAELTQLNDALAEFGHFLADMMSVDGALVLDHRFRLIGFGGEILGDTPVEEIYRALDLEANRSTVERADSAGTRHRSAFRLVNGLNQAIAVVVSQDGDVRFVAHHNQNLTYWPYLP